TGALTAVSGFRGTERRVRMSYVDESLMPNERVTFRTRLSPVLFAAPLAVAVVALAVLALGALAVAIGLCLLLVALGFLLLRYVSFASSEFAVTDKRVIMKVGVLRRRTLEMQLSKVEALAVNQSLLGRLFRFGDIVVSGTGGTKELFRQIGRPLEFRRAVQLATG
ncbi:MAG TPA: PH domain-containing protein, partial [Candidatus Dormibacteraeota bacterium]|nr:PH domain-containing protein [Candidatus Dormibacteraeota bacterium]